MRAHLSKPGGGSGSHSRVGRNVAGGIGVSVAAFAGSLLVLEEWVVWVLVSFGILGLAGRYFGNRHGVWLTPGWLLPGVLWVYYELRVLVLRVFPEDVVGFKHLSETYYSEALMDEVSLVGCVAIGSVVLGLVLGDRRRVKAWRLGKVRKAPLGWVAILYSLGILSDVLKAEFGFVHYGGVAVRELSTPVNRVLGIVSSFEWFAISYLVYLLLIGDIRNEVWRWAARLLVVGHLFVAVNSGGAAPIINWALVILVIGEYVSRGCVSGRGDVRVEGPFAWVWNRPLLLGSIGTSVIGVALYIKEVVRGASQFGYSPSIVGFWSYWHLFPELVTRAGVVETIGAGLRRFRGADALAVIMEKISSGTGQFLGGESLALIPMALVPRVVWEGKPDIARGIWFTDNYWRSAEQVAVAGEGTQGSAFLLVGDFYLNFGVAGVAVGMCAVGLMVAYLYKKLTGGGSGRMSELNVVVLPLALLPMILWEFSVASWLANFVEMALQFGVFWLLLMGAPALRNWSRGVLNSSG